MKASEKWSARWTKGMLSSRAIIFPKQQNLCCMQNIRGEIERDLRAAEYFALSFIHIHHADTANVRR